MDYETFQKEILALEKAKKEYIRSEELKGKYYTLFQISIDILGKAIYLGNKIRELKKSVIK